MYNDVRVHSAEILLFILAANQSFYEDSKCDNYIPKDDKKKKCG